MGVFLRQQPFDDGDHESEGFAGARLGGGEDVFALEGVGDGVGLDRRGNGELSVVQRLLHVGRERHRREMLGQRGDTFRVADAGRRWRTGFLKASGIANSFDLRLQRWEGEKAGTRWLHTAAEKTAPHKPVCIKRLPSVARVDQRPWN